MSTPQPERIIGRYALFCEIASGGMASVHLGRLLGPVGFSRVVAVKRLHPHLARDPEFVTMFIDEARLAARVQHPNVVPTLDVVALDGELFIVMEYVEGESLARLSRYSKDSGQRIPLDVQMAIIVGTLSGLHAAHEARGEGGRALRLVHRDISPQNILIGADGLVRVVDFGIAMAAGRSHRTASGVLKGKLRYMAPEQVMLEPVDRRTDIYAASVVLWELLSARRLFTGSSDFHIAEQIRQGVTEPPSKFNPEVSTEIDRIVLRGCARRPDDRFPSALEMAEALIAAAPCAIAGTIGRLVESLARESLARRRRLIEQAESIPSDLRVLSPEDRASISDGFMPEIEDEQPTRVVDESSGNDDSRTVAQEEASPKTRPGGAFARPADKPTRVVVAASREDESSGLTQSSWAAGIRRRFSHPCWVCSSGRCWRAS